MGMCSTRNQISQRSHLRRGAAGGASGAFFWVSDGKADTSVIVGSSFIAVFSCVFLFSAAWPRASSTIALSISCNGNCHAKQRRPLSS